MTSVNGCSRPDLKTIDTALRAGVFTSSEVVNSSCHIARDDVPMAYSFTGQPSTFLLHHVQLHAGLGLTF